MAGDVAVSLRGVEKRFGDVVAVAGVSFDVRRAEFFSILGPSGSGKTTILRMIAGFETPTGGEISIDGERVNDVPPFKRKTNLIFQQLALFPMMDVFENIAFGLRLRRRPQAEIRRGVGEIMHTVGLAGYERRRTHQLSGGEQQRVAIARCLVLKPSVLLLDEPLGALDLKLREQMMLELKAIQARVGTTFIYITHDQGEAITLSNRVAVLHRGRIMQTGSPEELYQRPANEFVAGFVGRTNRVEGTVCQASAERILLQRDGLTFLATRACPGRGDLPVGSPARFFLRPEKVRLLPPAAVREGHDNLLAARVAGRVFEGLVTSYWVRLENGLELHAVASNAKEAVDFAEGEPVNVAWPASDALILPPA